MSTYIRQALKRASRQRDKSAVPMLGPFAWLLAKIIEEAQSKRNKKLNK